MSSLKYGDERISDREILIAVPSMVISVGILALPKGLTEVTVAADGWISLVIAGIFAVIITWFAAKIPSLFPNQSFFTYSSRLASKPVAILLCLLTGIVALLITAYEIRQIAEISHKYLFDKTPIEVIVLTFLLVVVYAVSGSRAAILRLNMMFLPIIIMIAVILIIFSLGFMKLDYVLPAFETGFSGYLQGINRSITAFSGMGILFFYIALVNNPEKAPRKAALGMSVVVVLYLLLFMTTVSVFGKDATSDIFYPVVELAKAVEIPGGFFERFESIFFVIWMMAMFNTTTMAFDITIQALNSLFTKVNKIRLVFLLSPIIYVICMIPIKAPELAFFGSLVGYLSLGITVFTIVLLGTLYLVRDVKKS